MAHKVSLGIQPYDGKQLQDQEIAEPHDGIRRSNAHWDMPIPVLTPEQWVRQLATRRGAFFSTAGPKPFLDSAENLPKAEAIDRWLLNGPKGLFKKAECDVVLTALTREIFDPEDASEGPQERRERDQALALARVGVEARKAFLVD